MGAVPDSPFILCRDEKVMNLVMGALHKDWARVPPVLVADEWPEDIDGGAVVVTPLNIIGTDSVTSFAITGGEDGFTENERYLLNSYIQQKMASGGKRIAYRDMCAFTGWNRRTVSKVVKSLGDKGVGIMTMKDGFEIDIGTWRPDASKAQALGLDIEQY